jgi:hypothetical protein
MVSGQLEVSSDNLLALDLALDKLTKLDSLQRQIWMHHHVTAEFFAKARRRSRSASLLAR